MGPIIDAWEHERAPGLQAMFRTPDSELALRFGRPYSRQAIEQRRGPAHTPRARRAQ